MGGPKETKPGGGYNGHEAGFVPKPMVVHSGVSFRITPVLDGSNSELLKERGINTDQEPQGRITDVIDFKVEGEPVVGNLQVIEIATGFGDGTVIGPSADIFPFYAIEAEISGFQTLEQAKGGVEVTIVYEGKTYRMHTHPDDDEENPSLIGYRWISETDESGELPIPKRDVPEIELTITVPQPEQNP